VEALTPANNAACLTLMDRWARDPEAGAQLDMLNCERKAIVNGLKHFDRLELNGVLVKVDGEITGFAFGSRLSGDTFVLNFEKALDNVKGLYQFLDNGLEILKHMSCLYGLALLVYMTEIKKVGARNGFCR